MCTLYKLKSVLLYIHWSRLDKYWLLLINIDDGNGQVCISEIVPGSIAHRSGTLKVGDTLLAVNNKLLSDCTRQEASDILQESGDVVTLRVRTSNGVSGNTNSHFREKPTQW